MPAAVLLIDIEARLAKLEQGLTSANSHLSAFGKQFEDLGKKATSAIASVLSIEGIARAYETLKDKALESERAVNQLNAVLKATGGSAGLTKASLDEINQSLQGKSVFNTEQIREAEAALLRFRDVQGDVFKQAIELAPDVAAALGTDLSSAAVALGRALSGDGVAGMKALKAAGLSLSEQQIELAARMNEAGNRAGAQRLKLDELRKSVGGASEADTQGFYGATKRAARAWGDLETALGKQVVGQNVVYIELFTRVITKLAEAAEHAEVNLGKMALRFALPPGISTGLELVSKFIDRSNSVSQRSASGKIDTRAADEVNALYAQAKQIQKDHDEKAAADQLAAIKRRADNSAIYYAQELAQQKDFVTREQSALEASYSRNLVSSAGYYDKQRQLATKAFEAEFANLVKQGRDIEAALAAKIHGPNGEEAPALDRDQRLAYSAKLQGIANQQYEARLKLGEKLQDIDQTEIANTDKLTAAYAALTAQVLEARGDIVGAAIAEFNNAQRDNLRRIAADRLSPNAAERAAADEAGRNTQELFNAKVNTAQLNVETKLYSQQQDVLAAQVERVNTLQSAGYITEIDALNKTSVLNAQRISQLSEIADRYQAIANSPGLSDVVRSDALIKVAQMRNEIAKLATQTDLLGDKFRAVFVDGFTQAITDLATGGKKLSDIFKSLEQSIVSSISRIAAQNISESLFGKNGALGGVPGFFSSLFGGKPSAKDVATPGINPNGGDITDIFKTSSIPLTTAGTELSAAGVALNASAAALSAAASAISASSIASGASGGGGDFLSSLLGGGGDPLSSSGGGFGEHFASGTGFAPGGMALVGERGPELVSLPRGSKVIPNSKVQAMREARASSKSFNPTININLAGSVDRRSADQLAAAAYGSMVKAHRRVL